jgi:hypothetical protein
MAPILNEDQSWEFIGAISTGAQSHVRDAFRGRGAQKVLLPIGFTLYKFNASNSLLAAKEEDAVRGGPLSAAGAAFYGATLSPWWSPYDEYRGLYPGWLERKKFAKQIGVSVREWGRVTSAVSEDWSSLEWLLVVQLARPVYAFFGVCSQMPRLHPRGVSQIKSGESRGLTENLPGSSPQFYIPSFRPWHVGRWWAESLLNE